MAARDPFSIFDRIVSKYRRDVHRLAPGAGSDAIDALESHTGRRLPSGLRVFLHRYNGAELFRGALRIRSTSDVAPASDVARAVMLFADSHDGTVWAWGRNHDGGHAFGIWRDDQLEPLHGSFFGWLDATLEVLDARVSRIEDIESIRFEADPDDPYQLYLAGLRALHAGRPEEAQPLLERVTGLDPSHVLAWQRLGDALAASDRTASQRAWQHALRQAKLPLSWPGAPSLDPDIFPSLARSYADAEQWERELRRFLEERVHEVRTDVEFDLLVTATTALASSLKQRGKRSLARAVLAELMSRSTLYQVQRVPWNAALALADLEIDLGHHDEAEKYLRQIRLEAPDHIRASALVALGRLVIMREEPWAEEILDEALALTHRDDERVTCALLRVERAARQNRIDEAKFWLTRADRLVAKGAPRLLRAHAAVARADIHRIEDEHEEAAAGYERALEILGTKSATEMRLRIELRLGDLALAAGELGDARERFSQAATGFSSHELPLREGWALIRLARVSSDGLPLLDAARSRFVEADLAAGVAVVEALSPTVGRSLPWHLERATEHARARFNAQRSRPPWQRFDAERPERRLGAHRMAIAASGSGVVNALTNEIAAASRAIRAGRGRPLDPPVLRYTAAVDLLAGHRSYAAGEALLHHLVEGAVEGIARNALYGALARSPNAALVDGLLRCVERQSEMPATAVSAAADVLGLRREAEATAALTAMLGPGVGPMNRRAAIVALGRIGNRQVVHQIADALELPSLAEQAALALLMLGDRRGVDFHARAIAEQRTDLQGHPAEIVGRYGGPSHLLVLVPAASNENVDVSVGALQGLGLMGDCRAIPTLLAALDKRHPRRADVASGALQILTGHHESTEEAGLQRRWSAWWEQHQQDFRHGIRYRDGKPFDCGLLIHKMQAEDAWVRRTAYDELVVTSGHRQAFDSDGPWRIQLAHLRAWRSWWQGARARLPAGRWILDGRGID